MSIVYDICTLIDLNLLPKTDPRYERIAWYFDNDLGHVTPIVAAHLYRRLYDDATKARADNVLSMMRSGRPIRIADAGSLVDLAAEAMKYELPPTLAFTAALARRLDCPILTDRGYYKDAVDKGFCRVEPY